MAFLALSFLAGVLSVLAACVLPLLPVIVGGSLSTGGSRARMYTIILSLALSIVAFTLILKASTVFIGVPEELWRYISGGIILIIGVFMVFPSLWAKIPGMNALNRGSNQLLGQGYQRGGFWGDVLMGAALGPVFASCSPTYFIILATVLPVDFTLGLVYLTAYAAGLSLALLAIALLGERLVKWLGVSLDPSGVFFRSLGAILVVVGILVFTGIMRDVETWFVERGFDATFIELKLLGSEEESPVQTVDDAPFLSASMKQGVYPKAPELVAPDGYINTGGEPITIGQFRGEKVVLIDIWTYSCINCQRTFPYLRAWWEKYEDEGLVIIAVHTPEFAFEKVPANVRRAAEDFGLEYPIVLDNEYKTWNAFGNRFWPRKYLIDIDGYIVYDHIGEGAYAKTEQAIQRALRERAERLPTGRQGSALDTDVVAKRVQAPRAEGVGSPETYFGAWRNENFGNGVAGREGVQELSLPESLRSNYFYLAGKWSFAYEYAENLEADARIIFLYRSKDVYFVARADSEVRIRVTRDGGQPLGEARGVDVGADGVAIVKADGLYRLIEDSAVGTHTLEIEILDPGLEAYTFTFG
jgi:cytochrome c biogenesis protein CcdA/thiol-disulfide isomerase/thioredoxin